MSKAAETSQSPQIIKFNITKHKSQKFNLDLVNGDVYTQLVHILKKVESDVTDIVLDVNKMISFSPLVRMIKNDFHVKQTVHIVGRDRHHEYEFRVSNINMEVYIDNTKIDTSGNDLTIPFDEIDKDFVLDIFRFFGNIVNYTYKDKQPCEFHRDKSSAMYGAPSGYYKRVKSNIIEMYTDGRCCNYTGGSSYYNIEKNEREDWDDYVEY
jgi:hypothetical protein